MQHKTSRPLVAWVIAGALACGGQIAGAQSTFPPAGTPMPTPRVPLGYDPSPENLGLGIRAPKIDGPGFTATVTNRGSKPIVALTYLAVIEHVPHDVPITVLTSPEWKLTLAPGQTTELKDKWLDAEALDQLLADRGKRQAYFAPSRIRYADGSEWVRGKIDTTATDHLVALGFRAPGIPRALIAAEAGPASASNTLCRDEQRTGFSSGAVVPVRNEPGKQARCQGGRWVEVKP
jgi:hypothetical protein